MDILTEMESPVLWQDFLEYRKESCRLTEQEEQELRQFIESREYLPILERIRRGDPFPHPRKVAISKKSTSKKRIVYVYPPKESWVLKLMTHQLLRRYDRLFSPNLYSFRAGHGVKEAVHFLHRIPGISRMFSYKADIRNYFNSIPVETLLPLLKQAIPEDPGVYRFLESLLRDPLVWDQGKLIAEEKGIMAGCPLSTFLANLYLRELDRLFLENHWIYARYSDDIILFAETLDALEASVSKLHSFLAEAGLSVNREKEARSAPGEGWVFLGIRYAALAVGVDALQGVCGGDKREVPPGPGQFMGGGVFKQLPVEDPDKGLGSLDARSAGALLPAH